MTVLDRLQTLLTPAPDVKELDVAVLFASLFDRKYSGAITLHFRDGKPRIAEFEAPKLKLSA